MIATPKRMTPQQLRTAYRYAVEQCLVIFFNLNAPEATAATARWWGKIAAGHGLRSGLFLHAEAIDTAADLARGEEVPLSRENRERYRTLLEEASAHAVRVAELRDEVAENVLPDESEGLVARRQQTTSETLVAEPLTRRSRAAR